MCSWISCAIRPRHLNADKRVRMHSIAFAGPPWSNCDVYYIQQISNKYVLTNDIYIGSVTPRVTTYENIMYINIVLQFFLAGARARSQWVILDVDPI